VSDSLTPTAYSIAVDAGIANGTVTVADGIPAAAAGALVTLTVTAAPGWVYSEGSLTVNSGAVPVTAGANGSFTFTMPAEAVTITAAFVASNTPSVQAVVLYHAADGEAGDEVDDTYEATLDGAWAYLLAEGEAKAEYLILLQEDQAMTPVSTMDKDVALGMKITIRGAEQERKITWKKRPGTETLFILGQNTTLILDEHITVDGSGDEAAPAGKSVAALKYRDSGNYGGGTLIMNSGSKITNIKGQVAVISLGGRSGGTADPSACFVLNGGEISGNALSSAVSASDAECSVTIKSGAIKNNTGVGGGGIPLSLSGGSTALMEGGEISGHVREGVNVFGTAASFTMSGGTISGNKQGVSVTGTFTMSGGEISGNGTGTGVSGVNLNTVTASLILNGSVTIKDPVNVYRSNTHGIIYLGSGFSLSDGVGPIVLNIGASSASFITQWADTNSKVLQGGNIGAVTAITNAQFKMFEAGQGYKNSTFTSLMTGGAVVLTLEDGYGVAKWVAD
jgi:hypothetical protein